MSTRMKEVEPVEERPLSDLRIGLFGKGGAGKSTVTVFLAQSLRTLGYSVVILDADSTNVGLAKALGIPHEPLPLLEYFGGMVFSGGRVTCPVDDPAPLDGASIVLGELPAGFVPRSRDGIWLLSGGKLGHLGPGAGCDGPIAKIARDLRATVVGSSPVMLLDYKAGFEDSARGALTALDWALAVVDPTSAALQMAVHLGQMAKDIRNGVPPAISHLEPAAAGQAVRLYREARIKGVFSVLNRMPDEDTQHYVRDALESSVTPVVGVFREDPSIHRQWLRGERLRSASLTEGATRLARRLEVAEREAHAGVGASESLRA